MSVSDLSALIKTRQTLLLLLAMYAGYFVGGGMRRPLATAAAAGILGFAAIAATTALNMVYDVDIDAAMERTRHRPLPRGALDPRLVKRLSLTAIALSLVASFALLGAWYTLFMLLGFVADIYAYTLYSKRRSWGSIFLGSVAGMAPALGGYALAAGGLDARGFLLGALIAAWIPAHIWLLAVHYVDDYRRAGVPMLPVVRGVQAAVWGAAASIAAPLAAATGLLLLGSMNRALYALGTLLLVAAAATLGRCRPSSCMTPFKMVNASLAAYLLGVVLSAALPAS